MTSYIVNSQSNYAVTSIPFQQYSGSLASLSTMDDMNSPLISLPFGFDFYGITYNQIVVSTNGYIDFRTTSANSSSPFAFSQTIPNVNFPVKNAIFGAYHDLNNSNAQGTISYGVYGTAPYRKFIVNYLNNSLFACTDSHSSFQIILRETSNIIEVQLIDKQVCSNWNSGRTVTGITNLNGDLAVTPTDRNTGIWTAFHEGWRFSRSGYYVNYPYTICDDNTDGFASFNLDVVAVPSGSSFYASMLDLQNQSNPLPTNYTNSTNPQTIYSVGGGQLKSIVLSVVDCSIDADNDTVETALEDINNDGNLANDDTDEDGVPNYLDNDDDGDLILTNLEYVFGRNSNSLMDTDNDTIPNYLDNDDDGDGVLTFVEDYDGDGNPANDDTNNNSIADYLEMGVALGVTTNQLSTSIEMFPNPAYDVLNIQNQSLETIESIAIYAINGTLVKDIKPTSTTQSISVSDMNSGVYLVKIVVKNNVLNYKFIKK